VSGPAPDPLALAREALGGAQAWVVGGAVRDRILGRPTKDVDLAVGSDVEAAARTLGRAARAAVFPLSEAFGAWRVVARDNAWQADLAPLGGETIDDDLRLRDFTVNAIAEPLGGGDPIDPTGGVADLGARRLRMVSERSFVTDPLRVMRLPRFACELELTVDPATRAAAAEEAARLRDVAQERVFAELRRVVGAPDPLRGLELMREIGATAAVLPELEALRGIEQSHYHHLDVHDHTLAVLAETVAIERDPGAVLGAEHGDALRALLAQPFSDELSRGTALRFGALLHDIAKPQTRGELEGGRVTFFDHDRQGAELSRAILTRLRTSEKLRAHAAALALHHLRLGFLVHERPLSRRQVHAYLKRCQPVEVDVSLLSVADRLATRGRKSEEAIAKHVDLAQELIGPALAWEAGERPVALLRGDELADALGIARGPLLGELLGELEAAQYAGEVATREQAVAHSRRVLAARADAGELRDGER
jgi:putative nucleotidyltransferase with HDIG domain